MSSYQKVYCEYSLIYCESEKKKTRYKVITQK